MKIFLIIFFSLFTSFCFSQSKNNNNRIFNVKLFGAKGDGTTNDTKSIQAAINACNTAGGGTVWFPNGIYIIGDTLFASTSNSQLFIPPVNGLSTLRNHITIQGETEPNFIPTGGGPIGGAGSTLASGMVILKSTLTSGTTGGSVIGTALAGTFYNETFLSVKNLAIQIKNNPSGGGPAVGGISYKNGGGVPNIENVVVYIDTSVYRSVQPTNDVVGIETPDNSAETFDGLRNTLVVGFRTGYKIGEHCLLQQVQAMGCFYGINFKAGYHSTSGTRVGTYWCAYDIYVSGFCTLANFQLDAEWLSQGKWFDDVATIKDTANLATGQVYYTIIQGFVGKNNAKFIKTGGANLHCLTNDEGVSSFITPISLGALVGSATVKGLFYGGTGGILQQSSTKLAYDSAASKLCVGCSTPSAVVDAQTASGTDAGVNVTNSNTAAAAIVNTTNDLSDIASLRVFGSTNGNSGFPRNGFLIATNNLILSSDAGVSSGGKHAIKFLTGGLSTAQTKATLFSNGTLSINTTSDSLTAGAKLIVNGTSVLPTIVGGSATSSTLTYQTTSGVGATGADHIFKVGNNGATEAMRITNAGFVGIGATPTANSNLLVSGSSGSRTSIELQNTNTLGNASFYFQNNRGSFATYGGIGVGGATYATSFFGVTAADKTFLIADGASSLGLLAGTVTSQPFILGTNNTERIRIIGTGLVGINRTPTTDQLEVAGNISMTTAGNKLKITEGTNGSVGSAVLSSGTIAITISGLTTSSRALVTRTVATGTTLTTGVTAVCTSNTLTITADVAAGTINTADGSTYNYFVIN